MQINQVKFPIKGSVKQISKVIGLFDDLWVGKKLSFVLKSEYPIQEITLQGYLSSHFTDGNSFLLKVGEETQQISSPGNQAFKISIPVDIAAYQLTKIEMICEKVFNPEKQGVGADRRDLAFLLIDLNLKHGKTAGEYLKEGKILEKQGKFEAAIKSYYQAISLNQKFHWSYYKLAAALVKQGKYKEAIAHYQRALELNPNSALFHYNLAEALAEKGDWEAAVVYHQKSLEIDSNIPRLSSAKIEQLLTMPYQQAV